MTKASATAQGLQGTPRRSDVFRNLLSWLERDGPLATLLTLPTVLWILGIVGYPVVLVLWISLNQQGTIGGESHFIGLEAYGRIITSPEFWSSAWLTLIWTFANLIVIVPVGVGIAVLLNIRFKGQRFVRTWMLLPWMFPIIMTMLTWRWMLDPLAGIVNYMLLQLHIIDSPMSFTSSGPMAMATVVFVNCWRWTPFLAVVTLAALQTVPVEMYEAAKIDGANVIQMFRRITLPLIMPALSSTAFILTIWLFNMFPPIWLMTQGGPGDTTRILPIMIYNQGLQQFHMDDAATTSVLLLLLFVLPMGIIYFMAFGRRQLVESEEKQ